MLKFETRFTTVTVDKTIKVERKGKNPFYDELSWILLTTWIVDENKIFIKVGAYSITIKANNSKEILELIRKALQNPTDIENTISIKANNIKIEE